MDDLKNRLIETFGTLESEFQLLNQQCKQAVEQRLQLQSRCDELENDFSQVKSEIDGEKLANAECRRRIVELIEERRQLEMQTAELLQETERLASERQVLTKLYQREKTRREGFHRRVRGLWRGIGILKDESTAHRRQSLRLEQHINELKIENEALRISLSSHQSAMEELKRQTTQLSQDDREKLKAAKLLREEYQRTSEDLLRARRHINEIEARMARQEASARGEISNLQTLLHDRQGLLETRVREAADSTRVEHELLRTHLQEAQSRLRAFEKMETTLRGQMTLMEREQAVQVATIQNEHDRALENLKRGFEERLGKFQCQLSEQNAHAAQVNAADGAAQELRNENETLRQRLQELQTFAEKQCEEVTRLSTASETAHRLEREVQRLESEQQALQALWRNTVSQRDETHERNQELLQTIAEERHQHLAELADLRAQLKQAERQPTLQSVAPIQTMRTHAAQKDSKQWEDFYSRWDQKVTQLATGVVHHLPEIPHDLTGREIPEPPVHRVESLHDQLISERGDLQTLD